MVRTQTVAAAAGWVWVALAAGAQAEPVTPVGGEGAATPVSAAAPAAVAPVASSSAAEKARSADRFGALLGTYTFESGEFATPEKPAVGVAFAPLSRSGVLGDEAGGGGFGAKGWETVSSSDARGHYVEFSVRAAPGYRVTVNAIAFNHRGLGGAPAAGEVRYSTDGFAKTYSDGSAFSVSSADGGTVSEWDCPDVGVSGDKAVTFRFYAAAGGPVVLRLDDISVFGSVEKGETLGGAGGVPFENNVGTPVATARAFDGGMAPGRGNSEQNLATRTPIGSGGGSPPSSSRVPLSPGNTGGGTVPTVTGSSPPWGIPTPKGVPPAISITPDAGDPPPSDDPLTPPVVAPVPPPPELVPEGGTGLPPSEPEPTPPSPIAAVTQLPESSTALGVLAPVFALAARRRRLV